MVVENDRRNVFPHSDTREHPIGDLGMPLKISRRPLMRLIDLQHTDRQNAERAGSRSLSAAWKCGQPRASSALLSAFVRPLLLWSRVGMGLGLKLGNEKRGNEIAYQIDQVSQIDRKG